MMQKRAAVMSYEEARHCAQLRELDVAIGESICEFNRSMAAPEKRQRVFLFPGVAGSRLSLSSGGL